MSPSPSRQAAHDPDINNLFHGYTVAAAQHIPPSRLSLVLCPKSASPVPACMPTARLSYYMHWSICPATVNVYECESQLDSKWTAASNHTPGIFWNGCIPRTALSHTPATASTEPEPTTYYGMHSQAVSYRMGNLPCCSSRAATPSRFPSRSVFFMVLCRNKPTTHKFRAWR